MGRFISLLVLALAGERELVLWLSIWDLVDAEPLIGRSQETWEVALNILDIVELAGKWVVDIDDNDLPVGLLLIKKGHDAEDLDLLNLAWVADKLTNLADIKWIVITLGLGLWVDDVWVLPGLWEAAVVPEVSLVWEAVADEAELALLDILLDWVEGLLLGDLCGRLSASVLGCQIKSSAGLLRQRRGESSNSWYKLTSSLPLVHLGISTTMFKIVCCSLAYSGISWKGEIGCPSFSM